MKTGRSILKEKLTEMGYNDVTINSIVNKLNLNIIDQKISELTDEEIDGHIFTIEEYDSPNVEIIRTFLNIGDYTPNSSYSTYIKTWPYSTG